MSIDTQWGRGIDVEELHCLPLLKQLGLQIIVLCQHGQQRSILESQLFSEEGFPAVYIYGGLLLLSQLPRPQLQEAAEDMATISHMYAVLDEREQIRFAQTLSIISQARSNTQPLVIVPYVTKGYYHHITHHISK